MPDTKPDWIAQRREMQAAVDEAHHCGKHAASHAQGEQGIANSLKAGVDTIEHGIYLTQALIETMLKQRAVLVPTLTPMRRILLGCGEERLPEYAVEKAPDLGAVAR